MDEKNRNSATQAIAIALVLTCLGLSSAANAVTDNPTITIGIETNVGGGFTFAGFDSSISLGSISPTALADGKTYGGWWDVTNVESYVTISGFTSDPGQSWLTSAQCFSVTKTGASANKYTYNSSIGSATWNWLSQFGFDQINPTVACTLVHR